MTKSFSVSEHVSLRHHMAIPIALLAVLLSTRFGGYFSLPPSNISAFWPANALLFSAVFLLSAKQGGLTLLLALPVYAGAELWIGYPLRNAIVYGFANVAEVTVLLWLMRKTGTCSLAFDRLKDLFLLLSLALLASPVGGAIGAMTATQAGGAFGPVFLRWSLADFFGYSLCVPLVLTWRQWRQAFVLESPARIMEFAALLMILPLVSVISSGIHLLGLSAPLGAQFLPLPVLLWAALRFGPPGGAIATVIVACVAFSSATRGAGLFAAGAPEENVASLQLFFAALVISVMTIASLNAERKKSFDALREEVAERKQVEASLQESEAFLNSLLNAIPIPVFYKDRAGRYLGFNRAYEKFVGATKDSLVGKSVFDISPRELAEVYDTKDNELFKGEGEQHYESLVKSADGTLRDVIFNKAVFTDTHGTTVGLIGVILDITDRKRAEEEIRRLNRELERRVEEGTARLKAANKELAAFTYSVSHDLRAPLRHIDGFLGLLKERIAPALDEESRRYMATISEAALRMAALIDDLLSFSRLGRFEMVRTPVDLGDLVREVIRDFEPETKDRIVHWQLDEIPVVTGDRAMLRAVLVNLISNALKFTRTRAQAEITIGCMPEHEEDHEKAYEAETVVFVRDNGVGFDMQYAGKLFGVFDRLHGAEEFEGTGIGLANVRRVIERHGGRTWAEGKVDGGATFYFSLPRVSAEGLPDER